VSHNRHTRPLVLQRARPARRGIRPRAPRRYERLWADPSHREEQQTRRAALVARAHELSEMQRALSCELAEVRSQLAASRTVMWPELDRHLVRGFRHTVDHGPPPIPPVAPNAISLRGAPLRYAALAVLIDAGEPLTLTEIHRGLHLRGYRLAGRQPVQQLADALGYEHECGRAARVSRGTYTAGVLSPADRRRAADPASVSERSQVIVFDGPDTSALDEGADRVEHLTPPRPPAAEEHWRPVPP
jgi:hypothetical protein